MNVVIRFPDGDSTAWTPGQSLQVGPDRFTVTAAGLAALVEALVRDGYLTPIRGHSGQYEARLPTPTGVGA
jgi:hypothetical protein